MKSNNGTKRDKYNNKTLMGPKRDPLEIYYKIDQN
jgi:hypothetical protein